MITGARGERLKNSKQLSADSLFSFLLAKTKEM